MPWRAEIDTKGGGSLESDLVSAAASPRRLIVALTAAIAIGALSVVLSVVAMVKADHDDYDPLGDYPEQIVNSRVPGVEGPAVSAGDALSVTGKKCSNATTTVTVSGYHSWVSVEPPGIIVEAGRASGVPRDPGCSTSTFTNPMPKGVRERIAELAKAGTATSVWKLAGEECPIPPAGEGVAVCRGWSSEDFTIVDMN